MSDTGKKQKKVLSGDREAWERQKWESSPAFAAFQEYLAQGDEIGAKRSARGVAEKLGKSVGLIERWSRLNLWQERTRSYDNYIQREAVNKKIQEREKMLERHTGIALRMQKKALDALELINTGDLSARDIKEFIRLATELERQSRGADAEFRNLETDKEDALSRSLRELAERGIESD